MREVFLEKFSLTSYPIYEFGNGLGPSLTITAGLHGDEQTSVFLAHQLIEHLREIEVHGRIKIIPNCNPTAFKNRNRVSPYDKLDLNRIFPGKCDGTTSEILASSIWQEVQDTEYLVDLHCCGIYGSLYTYTLHQEYDHQKELARALGISTVVSGGTAGQLILEANKIGKKAILIEIPGGQPDGMINLAGANECYQALIRFLTFLGILNEITSPGKEVTFYGRIHTLKSSDFGLFLPIVQPGDHCEINEILGTLNGIAVNAPFKGVILAVNPPRYTFSGERLIRIAPAL